MAIDEVLQNAIETGEVLDIIYQGGSQPGTSRQISPISISNNKVRARCISSNTVKSFLISKITLPNEGGAQEVKQRIEGLPKIINFTSLSEFLEHSQDTLKGQGWHIITDDASISLHGFFKNGKPKKGAELTIHYEEYTYDLVAREDGEIHKENIRKSQRPWSVRAKTIDSRTYGTLDPATKTFMEWAKSLAAS